MKVSIDRNLCDHALPECERCFARFVSNPEGEDRACITEYVMDGDPILHLTLKYDREQEAFDLTPQDRVLLASEGWSSFTKVKPCFYRE